VVDKKHHAVSKSDEGQTIPFVCGCFITFWSNEVKLNSALACCDAHEAPHQTIGNLLKTLEIRLHFKDGLVEVAVCEVCGKKIMRTYYRDTFRGWTEWFHNDPHKSQYHMSKCYPQGKLHGSTTPDARPQEGSERYDIS
jgi:hypothetical protein